jgi:hypothetical protein
MFAWATDTATLYIRNSGNSAWIYAGGPKLTSSFVFTWGGDTNLYRNAANQLKTDDTMFANNFAENNGAVTVNNVQNTAGNVTSTSYVSTLSAGATCAMTFIAPATGKVFVHNTCGVGPGGTIYDWCDFQIRSGGSIGSGTVFRSPSDNTAIRHADSNIIHMTVTTLISGLTPGSTYNLQQFFKVNSGTGLFQDKEVIIQPVIY